MSGRRVDTFERVQIQDRFPAGDAVFLQDGAPCHTSKVTMDFLRAQGTKLEMHPAQSPDMNIIEVLFQTKFLIRQ